MLSREFIFFTLYLAYNLSHGGTDLLQDSSMEFPYIKVKMPKSAGYMSPLRKGLYHIQLPEQPGSFHDQDPR